MDFSERLSTHLIGKLPSGCTEAEVTQIERRHRVKLPESYSMFLRQAGRGAKGLWTGSDFEFHKLDELQEWARELLGEEVAAPLPTGAFVFYMHQGYQFFYFLGQEVWFYMEGRRQAERQFSTFEHFFEALTV